MIDAVRPYDPATDGPALAALMNAIEIEGTGRATTDEDTLASLIASLVRDTATDSVVVPAPDGAFAAAGFATTPPVGGRRVFLTGGVHPGWRGRGLGRLVLARCLDRARAIHAAAAAAGGVAAPWEAQVLRAPEHDAAAARLYERHGLRPTRWWHEMSAAPRPARPDPDGWDVRPYDARLDAVVHAAHQEAFARNAGHTPRALDDWVALTVRAPTFAPRLSFVAFDGEDVAGHVLTQLDPDPARVVVSHLGVRPAWRRRGLAGALIERVLDAAAAEGRAAVDLSVDADSATGAGTVYERAGFVTTHTAVTWSTTL